MGVVGTAKSLMDSGGMFSFRTFDPPPLAQRIKNVFNDRRARQDFHAQTVSNQRASEAQAQNAS